MIRCGISDTMNQEAYAISKPIRILKRDERLGFTLGRGMCLGFNRMSCSSSLERSMRWTQNSSLGSSGVSMRPETLYSYSPKGTSAYDNKLRAGKPKLAYRETNSTVFLQNSQHCRGKKHCMRSANNLSTSTHN
jgi:hypothetical protein